MCLHRITSVSEPLFGAFIEIFNEAFPVSERRTQESLCFVTENVPNYHCEVCLAADGATEVEGLLCYWTFPEFSYIEYLAVSSRLRGTGTGTGIMSKFLAESAKPVILEVEPPVDALTRRRVAFYERLGFTLLPDKYIQPSYGLVPGPELKLMAYNPMGAKLCVPTVITTLHRDVYGVNASE